MSMTKRVTVNIIIILITACLFPFSIKAEEYISGADNNIGTEANVTVNENDDIFDDNGETIYELTAINEAEDYKDYALENVINDEDVLQIEENSVHENDVLPDETCSEDNQTFMPDAIDSTDTNAPYTDDDAGELELQAEKASNKILKERNTHRTIPENSYGKTYNYLFIGNSLTYYNNLPQIYANIVKNGTGDILNITTLLYSARLPYTHARAIKAVIRTEGDPSKLTDTEKKLFESKNTPLKYDADVFNEYKNAVLDSNNRIKTYDYIIIQDHARNDHMMIKTRKTLKKIIKCLGTKNTHILINIPHSKLEKDKSLSRITQTYNKRKADVEEAVNEIRNKKKLSYASLDIVYAGQAEINYFNYNNGLHCAEKYSPDDFYIPKRALDESLVNDFTIGDGIHMTLYASYMNACLYYSTIYGRDAAETVSAYKGDSLENSWDMGYRTYGTNFSLQQEQAGMKYIKPGISSNRLLKMAADTAFLTYIDHYGAWQIHGWNNIKNIQINALSQLYTLEKPVIQKTEFASGTVNITWKPVPGAKIYRIYRKTPDGYYAIGQTSKTSFNDTNAGNGDSYTYSVRCMNPKGTEPLSSLSKAVTIK